MTSTVLLFVTIHYYYSKTPVVPYDKSTLEDNFNKKEN